MGSSASNTGDVPRLELDVTETLLRAPFALAFYLTRTVLPRGLCPLYYLPDQLHQMIRLMLGFVMLKITEELV